MSAILSLRLRDLPLLGRFGVACAVLVLLGGLGASGAYLYMHQEERDERAGWSIDDVKGHYHGLVTRAPLTVALESGHPEDLPNADREALLTWLAGDRLSLDFDNLDLGDAAPAEIMAVSCLDCHARSATGPEAMPEMSLELWDDVYALAQSRDIKPVSTEILAASTHTHALSLATLTLVLALLCALTAWPRWLVGGVTALSGLGLLIDISSWWLTRWNDSFAWAIVGGGFVYNVTVLVLGLMVLGELVRPKGSNKSVG